ncbi:MAG: hypoxanthine-guanine phosphoribosyltransferase [Wenzhouxiangellaceae bacterium]
MIPEGAERLWQRAEVEAAFDRMAKQLHARLADSADEVLLLPVMLGGMFAACELAQRLRLPLRFDYVHATRYRGATEGGALEWRHWPSLEDFDGPMLLVDDIFDEGHTMAAIVERIPDPGRVVTVALVRKLHDRGLDRDWIDVWGLDVPDRYVFGCGMDYQERLRELPEIWALPE